LSIGAKLTANDIGHGRHTTGVLRCQLWKDGLLPLARSKVVGTGRAEPEERDLAKQKEEVRPLLADFHKDDLDAHGLCQKLKSGTPLVIREVQLSLIESISISYHSRGFERRKAAILELEALKKNQRASLIEERLNKIGKMRRAYGEALEETLQEVTGERDRNINQRSCQADGLPGMGRLRWMLTWQRYWPSHCCGPSGCMVMNSLQPHESWLC
jgi:hypothetical protein